MIKKSFYIILILGFCWAFKSDDLIRLQFPNYFPKPHYNFKNNPLDSNKIQLGRALFYDPILSKDNTISCSSCHSPFNAFAHTDHDLSHGIKDQIGTRNAPALFNLAWHKSFMWDGAIHHLDMQALAPISSSLEMGDSLPNVLQKLRASSIYPKLFQQAYKDSTITGEQLLKAIAQFQLTLISSNSKYDRVKRQKATFNEQEQKGYELFKIHCNSCHQEPLFTKSTFANNGLPLDTTLNDYGKGMISKQKQDSGLFKVPSLRNLSYSFPYMHDGRFEKLSQVLKHYTHAETQLHFENNLNQKAIQLTSNEKVDLISFLLTLNDKEFVFKPEHQFPKEILLHTKENRK